MEIISLNFAISYKINLLSDGRFYKLIEGDKPVLVDFTAEWCGPCKAMSPILAKLKQTIGDGVIILKVDIDKNQHVATAYKIQSVPTLILFKNGRICWRQTGLTSADSLRNIIEKHQ